MIRSRRGWVPPARQSEVHEIFALLIPFLRNETPMTLVVTGPTGWEDTRKVSNEDKEYSLVYTDIELQGYGNETF